MGYIQFDKVDVPEDNVVSLGLLNRQLQKQRKEHLRREAAAAVAAVAAGVDASPARETAPRSRKHVTSAVSPSSALSSRSVRTTASPTSVSMAELWKMFMEGENLPVCGLGAPTDKPSLDEETCGMRYNTVPAALCVSGVSTPSTEISSTTADSRELELGIELGLDLDLNLNLELELRSSTAELTKSVSRTSTQPGPERLPLSLSLSLPAEEHGHDATSYQCSFCPSNFKVKGYLTRHMKKHAAYKEFRCPYWSQNCKCHPTGEFSRKDTFKTHLKSIHFVYPVGVIKSQRNKSPGRCAACFQQFDSNSEWLMAHIERGLCEGLASVKKEDSSWAFM